MIISLLVYAVIIAAIMLAIIVFCPFHITYYYSPRRPFVHQVRVVFITRSVLDSVFNHRRWTPDYIRLLHFFNIIIKDKKKDNTHHTDITPQTPNAPDESPLSEREAGKSLESTQPVKMEHTPPPDTEPYTTVRSESYHEEHLHRSPVEEKATPSFSEQSQKQSKINAFFTSLHLRMKKLREWIDGVNHRYARVRQYLNYVILHKKLTAKLVGWLINFLKSCTHMVRLERFSMSIDYGCSDPAITAVAYSIITFCFQSLCGLSSGATNVSINPVFERTPWLNGEGAITIRTSVGRLLWPFGRALMLFPYLSVFYAVFDLWWKFIRKRKKDSPQQPLASALV